MCSWVEALRETHHHRGGYLCAQRFNPATHQVFSWTTIVFQLFTSASTLFGLSLFVHLPVVFPVTWTILGAGP